jgi:hypothetical protein
MGTLEHKIGDFDRHADEAVTWLVNFLEDYREPLIHAARGRLVEGHFRYGDRLMYELSRDELAAETLQELADAVNYIARRLTL